MNKKVFNRLLYIFLGLSLINLICFHFFNIKLFGNDFDFINSVCTTFTTYLAFQISQASIFQSNIRKKGQLDITKDIIRHIYRNKVVIIAMISKYKYMCIKEKELLHYPSEDHYNKLRLLNTDLDLHNLDMNEDNHTILHQAYLNIRNLDIEIDAAIIHAKDSKIINPCIIRDLQNIDYKLSKINSLLIDYLIKKDPNFTVLNIIKDSHLGTIGTTNILNLGTEYDDLIKETILELNSDISSSESYYNKMHINKDKDPKHPNSDKYMCEYFLYNDSKIECGNNLNGSSKILIISQNK